MKLSLEQCISQYIRHKIGIYGGISREYINYSGGMELTARLQGMVDAYLATGCIDLGMYDAISRKVFYFRHYLLTR